MITRTARARASCPSCVAVYPRDSDRDVFYPLASLHGVFSVEVTLPEPRVAHRATAAGLQVDPHGLRQGDE
jgi:hypothetical protein